jgi:hypothetical protein
MLINYTTNDVFRDYMAANSLESKKVRYIVYFICQHCQLRNVRWFSTRDDFENDSVVQNLSCTKCFIDLKPPLNIKLPLIRWGNIQVVRKNYYELQEITCGEFTDESCYVAITGDMILSGILPDNVFGIELILDH